MEGLLNCLIPVVTNVTTFRKEVRDFIFNNRNEVLSNFSFAGKILPSGRVRGRRRDDWLEKEVEARMWEEDATFLPECEEFYYVDANWHFPVMAVMHDVNFVWYDVKEGSTCACVKVNVDGLLNEKTIHKKGFIKPEIMTEGSAWNKRVCIIFYKRHFMHLKEFLGCSE